MESKLTQKISVEGARSALLFLRDTLQNDFGATDGIIYDNKIATVKFYINKILDELKEWENNQ